NFRAHRAMALTRPSSAFCSNVPQPLCCQRTNNDAADLSIPPVRLRPCRTGTAVCARENTGHKACCPVCDISLQDQKQLLAALLAIRHLDTAGAKRSILSHTGSA